MYLMKRLIRLTAVALSIVGGAACLAALISIWAIRPSVLQTSQELLETAEDTLKLVEIKSQRADELMREFRAVVDPLTGKLLKVVDKDARAPELDEQLKKLEHALAERVQQADSIAEAAETAITLMEKTNRLVKSLPRRSDGEAQGRLSKKDSMIKSDRLSKLAQRVKDLREILAKLREDRQDRKIVENMVQAVRDFELDVQNVDAALQRVNEQAAERAREVAELRSSITTWINGAAVMGSVCLAWIGLSQFVVLRRAWGWSIQNRKMSQ